MGRRQDDEKTPVTDPDSDDSQGFNPDSEEVVEEYTASSDEMGGESEEIVEEYLALSDPDLEDEEVVEEYIPSSDEFSGDDSVVQKKKKKGSPRGMKGVKTLGPYQLLEEVGRGGMGVVYKAFHAELKRTVALKVLIAGEDASDTAIARFHREAESVAKLGHHANIVPVYDIGTRGSLHYFAMHFVEGRGLDAILEDRDLPPRKAAELCMRIARGLEHAHRQGVLHRDIKPGNILITQDGEPQITDFGLAKDVEAESDITRSGTTLGTPQYMPPEQAEGQADLIGPGSDVYSLGATLYHMLVFRPPFRAQTLMHLLKKVILDDPLPLRRIDAAIDRDLETICLKCLEKKPARRYPSAEELARDLERYLAREPIEARPSSTWERLGKRMQRNKPAALALAGLFLALVAGLVFTVAGFQKGASDESRAMEHIKKAKAKEKKAEKTQKWAQRLIDKSRKVSRMLRTAMLELRPVLKEFEQSHYSSLSELERRNKARKAWPQVEVFFTEKVEDDATSRSVALGIRGWLRYLAGFEDQAFDDFKASREADEEVAYGLLFEGAVWLSRYLRKLPTPSITVSEGRVALDELPEESPELKAHRKEFKRVLEEFRKVPYWGEGVSREIRDMFTSLHLWKKEDLPEVEKSLSHAIGSPELAWIEVELRMARGKIRYFSMEFDKALEDLDSILKDHPDNLGAQLMKSSASYGLGATAQVRREDPEPYIRSALKAYDRAIEIAPDKGGYYNNRGVLRKHLAKVIAQKGSSWDDLVKLSVDDFTKAIELEPHDLRAWLNRGAAYTLLASMNHTEPETLSLLMKSIEDLTHVVEKNPDFGQAWNNRAIAHNALGKHLLRYHKNPLKAFEAALEDLSRAEQTGETSVAVYQNRGNMEQSLGEALALHGQDPTDPFLRAEKALRKALTLSTSHWKAYYNLGMLYERWGRHKDGLTAYREASRIVQGRVRILTQRSEELERFLRLPSWRQDFTYGLRLVLEGAYQEAMPVYLRAVDQARKAGAHEDPERRSFLIGPYYYLACLYAQAAVGRKGAFAEPAPVDKEKARLLLEKGMACLSAAVDMGFDQLEPMEKEARLDPLRSLDGFAKLLEKVRGK